MVVFKQKRNSSHKSNLTENYARTTRVLHLQVVSFGIIFIKLLEFLALGSATRNLPVEGRLWYCICLSIFQFCYSRRIWKLLFMRAGRESLQKKGWSPIDALDSQVSLLLNSVTKVKEVAGISSSWRNETLRWCCWQREMELFFWSIITALSPVRTDKSSCN